MFLFFFVTLFPTMKMLGQFRSSRTVGWIYTTEGIVLIISVLLCYKISYNDRLVAAMSFCAKNKLICSAFFLR